MSEPVYFAAPTHWVSEHIVASQSQIRSLDTSVVGFGLSTGLQPEFAARDVLIQFADGSTLSVDTLLVSVSWSSLFGGPPAIGSILIDHANLTFPQILDAEAFAFADRATLGQALSQLEKFGAIHGEIGSFTATSSGRLLLSGATITMERGAEAGTVIHIHGTTGQRNWSLSVKAMMAGAAPHMLVEGQFDPPQTDDGLPDQSLMSARLSLSAALNFAPSGQLQVAEGAVDSAPTNTFGAAHLSFNWKEATRKLTLGPSATPMNGGVILLSGEIADLGSRTPQWPVRLNVEAQGLHVAPGEALINGQASVNGTIDPFHTTAQSTSITLRAMGVTVTGEGAAALEGAPSAHFMLQANDIPVEAVKALWPASLSPRARAWVWEHMQTGGLTSAHAELTYPTRDEGEDAPASPLALSFQFANADFLPFAGGPMIRSASGAASLGDDVFKVQLTNGQIDAGDGHTLAMADSTLTLSNLDDIAPTADINMHLSGDAGAGLATALKVPGLGALLPSAKPDGLTGKMTAEMDLNLPVAPSLTLDDVTATAKVQLNGVSFAQPLDGHRVEKLDATIAVADEKATIKGKANIDGVAAALDFVRPLAELGTQSSRVHFIAEQADRQRLGYNFDFISGPVDVTLSDSGANAASRHRVRIDLTQAKLDLPWIGLTKPKGIDAILTFDLIDQEKGAHRIENATMIGSKLAFTGGVMQLNDKGELQTAEVPELRLAATDQVALKVERQTDGVLKIRASGSKVDGRNLIAASLASAKNTTDVLTARQSFEVRIDEFLGFGSEKLRGLTVTGEIGGGRVQALKMNAKTASGGTAALALSPNGTSRILQGEITDSGRILRLLNLYPRISGGHAKFNGHFDEEAVLTATSDWQKLQITDEPALVQLAKEAPDGPAQSAKQTVDLKHMSMDFKFSRGILTVIDCILRTETAGASLSGDVDFGKATVKLSGSYLPATGLDNLFGWIPVIGETVQNGGRAGIFGVTFNISGSLKQPEFSMNPLSLIAPGIFRQIFELK